VYVIDCSDLCAMLLAAVASARTDPPAVEEHLPVRRAIGDGVRFVRDNNAL